MDRNVGFQEAAVRVLFGAIVLAIGIYLVYFSFLSGIYFFSLLTVIFLIVAGLLLTGVFRWCPLNEALGRDFRGSDREATKHNQAGKPFEEG